MPFKHLSNRLMPIFPHPRASGGAAFIKSLSGALLLQSDHTQGTSVKCVETAVLEKCIVTKATTLLEDAYEYEDADGGNGTTVLLVLMLLGEQRTEDFLVYDGGHLTIKHIVPGRRSVILAAFTPAHQIGWRVEQMELLVGTTFLAHQSMLLNKCKGTKLSPEYKMSKSDDIVLY